MSADGSPFGRRARVVAALAGLMFVLAGLAGGAVAATQGKVFRSTAVMNLDQPFVVQRGLDSSPILKLTRLRASYSDLVPTTTVADPIGASTGLTSAEVAHRVRVVVLKDSLLLLVEATGSSPEAARSLAEASALELQHYTVARQEQAAIRPAARVVLSTVTAPADGVAVTRNVRTVASVGVFTGLVGAGIVVALASLARPAEE